MLTFRSIWCKVEKWLQCWRKIKKSFDIFTSGQEKYIKIKKHFCKNFRRNLTFFVKNKNYDSTKMQDQFWSKLRRGWCFLWKSKLNQFSSLIDIPQGGFSRAWRGWLVTRYHNKVKRLQHPLMRLLEVYQNISQM